MIPNHLRRIVSEIEPLEARIAPATIVVTTLADTGDGTGSLRSAIDEANSTLGADTITFAESGTIKLASALPAIMDDLTITGAKKITLNGQKQFRSSKFRTTTERRLMSPWMD